MHGDVETSATADYRLFFLTGSSCAATSLPDERQANVSIKASNKPEIARSGRVVIVS